MTRDVAGAVLAGGASRRMGTDKAAIELGGRALAQRALDALSGAGVSELVVVGGPSGYGAALVEDRWPGSGPLGGIITAFDATVAPRIVVLPCDLPGVEPRHVTALLLADVAVEGEDARRALTVGVVGGRAAHPIGVWHRWAAPHLAEAFAAGERSMRGAVAGLAVGEVVLDDGAADADHPAALARAGSLPRHVAQGREVAG